LNLSYYHFNLKVNELAAVRVVSFLAGSIATLLLLIIVALFLIRQIINQGLLMLQIFAMAKLFIASKYFGVLFRRGHGDSYFPLSFI
tara:strand:+ start:964 stop:1224 length:261 start_codon:yes stop_codon:yes gene_type:complete